MVAPSYLTGILRDKAPHKWLACWTCMAVNLPHKQPTSIWFGHFIPRQFFSRVDCGSLKGNLSLGSERPESHSGKAELTSWGGWKTHQVLAFPHTPHKLWQPSCWEIFPRLRGTRNPSAGLGVGWREYSSELGSRDVVIPWAKVSRGEVSSSLVLQSWVASLDRRDCVLVLTLARNQNEKGARTNWAP